MSLAKFIKPAEITDAMLTSSTVAEPDVGETAWVSGGTYVAGDIRIRTATHRKYRAKVGHSGVSTLPENDSTNWQDIGPTNKWAMFDRAVGTQTTDTGTLTVTIADGGVAGLGMLELVGRTVQITKTDSPGGIIVYDRTIDLDASAIESVYDWFFSEFEQRSDFAITDLPAQFTSGELTVTISGTGAVKCGVLKVGVVTEIGRTTAGASVTINDYSGKETDEFGATTVVEREYSKRASAKIITEKSAFNKLFRRFADVRATPCVWIFSEAKGNDPLIVYGYYREFSIDAEYTQHHVCNIQVEGLT